MQLLVSARFTSDAVEKTIFRLSLNKCSWKTRLIKFCKKSRLVSKLTSLARNQVGHYQSRGPLS